MPFFAGQAALSYGIESIVWKLRLEIGTTLSNPRDVLKDPWSEWESGTPEQLADFRRFFCHTLINAVPDAGLEEAVESLSDILVFHTDVPPQLPAPPPREKKRVRVGEARIRSNLVIAPEEP